MDNQTSHVTREIGLRRMKQIFGVFLIGFIISLIQPGNAAVITVTGTGDTIAVDGLATLREAITSINNQADVNADVTVNRVGNYASLAGGTPDVINFIIAGTGVHTISPVGAEP